MVGSLILLILFVTYIWHCFVANSLLSQFTFFGGVKWFWLKLCLCKKIMVFFHVWPRLDANAAPVPNSSSAQPCSGLSQPPALRGCLLIAWPLLLPHMPGPYISGDSFRSGWCYPWHFLYPLKIVPLQTESMVDNTLMCCSGPRARLVGSHWSYGGPAPLPRSPRWLEGDSMNICAAAKAWHRSWRRLRSICAASKAYNGLWRRLLRTYGATKVSHPSWIRFRSICAASKGSNGVEEAPEDLGRFQGRPRGGWWIQRFHKYILIVPEYDIMRIST